MLFILSRFFSNPGAGEKNTDVRLKEYFEISCDTKYIYLSNEICIFFNRMVTGAICLKTCCTEEESN